MGEVLEELLTGGEKVGFHVHTVPGAELLTERLHRPLKPAVVIHQRNAHPRRLLSPKVRGCQRRFDAPFRPS